ncbi:MAG: hypothetical protein JW982_08715 [Spirochaetes bacterium]|nr:hypothetical protein [Spirochaetota bacterium]
MRNKQTNFLQVVVLYTGAVYIISGLIYFISPGLFASIIGLNVNQDWIGNIALDEFIFLFYSLSRTLAFILFTSGLAMILPLFDPLKYRGLVYYNGLIFSGGASAFLMTAGIIYKFNTMKVMAAVFIFQFILTLTALMLTKGNANRGIE